MMKYPAIRLAAAITITDRNTFPARIISMGSFAREDIIRAGVAI